jgi:hypothetical protein
MIDGIRQDLAVLVPDKDIEATLQALLKRPEALAIRAVSFRIYVNTDRDPGCLLRPQTILHAGLAKQFAHALVVFDHDGCGQEDKPREELEAQAVDILRAAGWEDRAEAVVIDPELENWVWSDSPHVATGLGWPDSLNALCAWLQEQGLWNPDYAKPADPKACVERVRRHVLKPRSSAMYGQLAASVSTSRCTDPAFAKLKRILHGWFTET